MKNFVISSLLIISIGVVNLFAISPEDDKKMQDLIFKHLPFGWKLGETTIEDAKKKGLTVEQKKDYDICKLGDLEFYFSKETKPSKLQSIYINSLKDFSKLMTRAGLKSPLKLKQWQIKNEMDRYYQMIINDNDRGVWGYIYEDYSIQVIYDFYLGYSFDKVLIEKQNMLEW